MKPRRRDHPRSSNKFMVQGHNRNPASAPWLCRAVAPIFLITHPLIVISKNWIKPPALHDFQSYWLFPSSSFILWIINPFKDKKDSVFSCGLLHTCPLFLHFLWTEHSKIYCTAHRRDIALIDTEWPNIHTPVYSNLWSPSSHSAGILRCWWNPVI